MKKREPHEKSESNNGTFSRPSPNTSPQMHIRNHRRHRSSRLLFLGAAVVTLLLLVSLHWMRPKRPAKHPVIENPALNNIHGEGLKFAQPRESHNGVVDDGDAVDDAEVPVDDTLVGASLHSDARHVDLALDTSLADEKRAFLEGFGNGGRANRGEPSACPVLADVAAAVESPVGINAHHEADDARHDPLLRKDPNRVMPPTHTPIELSRPLHHVTLLPIAIVEAAAETPDTIIAAATSALRCVYQHSAVYTKEQIGEKIAATTYRLLPLSARQRPAGSTIGDGGHVFELFDEFGFEVATEAITLFADTPSAIFHALYRIKQALASTKYALSWNQWRESIRFEGVRVAAARLHRDGALHAWRGVLLDSARHFVSVDDVERLLAHMAELRLNVLHWHLTDDQGWRVEVPSLPELTQIGARRGFNTNPASYKKYNDTTTRAYLTPAYYSTADVRRILGVARLLHITVVPEIDIPAHSAALLRALEYLGNTSAADTIVLESGKSVSGNSSATFRRIELSRADLDTIGVVDIHEGCAARSPRDPKDFVGAVNCMGGVHGLLYPSPATLRLLKHILEYLLSDLFDETPFVHIGGDEADTFRDHVYGETELGRRLRDAAKVSTAHDLQTVFLEEIRGFVATLGRTVIAWDDSFIPGPPLKGDSILMWWRDWYAQARWDPGVKGVPRRKILTPQSMTYLDSFQFEPHTRSKYAVQEGTVPLDKVFQLMQFSTDKLSSAILGVEACLWTETLTTFAQIEYQLFPRIFALACAGWLPSPAATRSSRAYTFDDFT